MNYRIERRLTRRRTAPLRRFDGPQRHALRLSMITQLAFRLDGR